MQSETKSWQLQGWPQMSSDNSFLHFQDQISVLIQNCNKKNYTNLIARKCAPHSGGLAIWNVLKNLGG